MDTAKVRPDDRLAYWVDTAISLYGPLNVRRTSATPFGGTLRHLPLGPLDLYRTDADPLAVGRTARMIRPSNPDGFSVLLHLRGQCRIDVRDQHFELRPGDLLISSDTEPFAIDCDGSTSFSNIEMTIPRPMIQPYADTVTRNAAVRLPRSLKSAALLGRYLRDLVEVQNTVTESVEDTRLAESALDLFLALALRRYADDVPGTAGRTAALVGQVKSYIDSQLWDKNLGPTTIARANAVSPRLLHKAFEAEGTTVGMWIRARRIERCCQDLADPLLAERSIGEIATCWGFTNHAHFSRLFRSLVGCSPREFRQLMGYRAKPSLN